MATIYPVKKIDRDFVCERLKAERLKLGLTQQEVADRSKVSVTALCALENKRRALGLDILYRLCQGLGLSMDEVIKGVSLEA